MTPTAADMAGPGVAPFGEPGASDAGHGFLEGTALYETFRGFAPARVRTVRHPRLMPPVVVELGELVGLIYRSDKGRPGRASTYIHRMEDPPLLASDPSGSQLYLIGGSYRVTARGIEG